MDSFLFYFIVQLIAIILIRSEEHTSELQSHVNLVCRLLLEKKRYHDIGARLSEWATYTHQQPAALANQLPSHRTCQQSRAPGARTNMKGDNGNVGALQAN